MYQYISADLNIIVAGHGQTTIKRQTKSYKRDLAEECLSANEPH